MHTKHFWRSDSGSTAVIFTAALLPMLLAAGIAIDYGRAASIKQQLQQGTDAAAIAAAAMDPGSKPSNGERQTRALQVLTSNITSLAGQNGLQKSVRFGDGQINVSVEATVQTTLAKLILPEMPVSVSSSAKFATFSAPLCLLALNTAAAETFKAWGTADLVAPDCAIQSHSTSAMGMATGGSATATAAHFCSAGGHSGTGFDPAVQDNCNATNDPYAGKYSAQAMKNAGVDVLAGCNHTTPVDLKKQENLVFNAGGPTNTYVFCDFLKLGSGASVTFMPGIYVFADYVEVTSGSTLNAPDGVTFYFVDKNNYAGAKESNTPLTVQAGGNLNLVAPKKGPLAGMAIVHPTASAYTGGTKPVSTHTIIGGGKINIVGTIYAPQAKIRVTGNGTINDTSSYFSIIAEFVELEGNGQLHINAGADVMATGMPEMVSMGNGGSADARLIK